MERIKWKKEPLVSVIIPAFNGEKYIGDATDQNAIINVSFESQE